jgi:hypothetical protein
MKKVSDGIMVTPALSRFNDKRGFRLPAQAAPGRTKWDMA